MSEMALDPSAIILREVTTLQDAGSERFVGSPTIRIDGVDVQPPGDEPVGLSCRVYHRRDGRVSPTPDPADVRAALEAAGARSTPGPPSTPGPVPTTGRSPTTGPVPTDATATSARTTITSPTTPTERR